MGLLSGGEVMHVYEVRPRKDHRGVDLISDALPFGRLSDGEPDVASNTIGYASFYCRSHRVVIRVCDHAGKAIETHQFKEPYAFLFFTAPGIALLGRHLGRESPTAAALS